MAPSTCPWIARNAPAAVHSAGMKPQCAYLPKPVSWKADQ